MQTVGDNGAPSYQHFEPLEQPLAAAIVINDAEGGPHPAPRAARTADPHGA